MRLAAGRRLLEQVRHGGVQPLVDRAAATGAALSLTNLAVAVSLALAGPGGYALDAVLGIHVPLVYAEFSAVAALVAVLVGIVSHRAAVAPSQPHVPAEAA